MKSGRTTTKEKKTEVKYSKFVFILKFYDVGIFLLKRVNWSGQSIFYLRAI